jgi:hypothetical protein
MTAPVREPPVRQEAAANRPAEDGARTLAQRPRRVPLAEGTSEGPKDLDERPDLPGGHAKTP